MRAATFFMGPSVVTARRHWPDGPKELPPIDLKAMHGSAYGDCLAPVIHHGENITLIDEAAKPWHIAAIAIKDDVMWRAKIYLTTIDRGSAYLETFGDDQPDRLVLLAALNPLAVYGVAERDVLALRTVVAVLGHGGFRNLTAGVTLEPGQWQAVQEALSTKNGQIDQDGQLY